MTADYCDDMNNIFLAIVHPPAPRAHSILPFFAFTLRNQTTACDGNLAKIRTHTHTHIHTHKQKRKLTCTQ